jgi:hypothetical protein
VANRASSVGTGQRRRNRQPRPSRRINAIVSVAVVRPATSSRLTGHHDGPHRQCDPTGDDSQEEQGAFSALLRPARPRPPAALALAIELAALAQADATNQ